MEIRLIRWIPRSQRLIRKRARAHHGAKEVHPPLRPFRLPVIDVEESERDLNVRDPGVLRLVEGGFGKKAVGVRHVPVGCVEGGARSADFGGVIDEGLEAGDGRVG